MAKVVNLNRYRKRRAREEKEKQADRNRRLHGRTKAERALEAADKKRLEKNIDGAFLVRERVPVQTMLGDAKQTLLNLERATRQVLTLSEYAARLRKPHGTEPSLGAEQESAADDPNENAPAAFAPDDAAAPEATEPGVAAPDAPAPDAPAPSVSPSGTEPSSAGLPSDGTQLP